MANKIQFVQYGYKTISDKIEDRYKGYINWFEDGHIVEKSSNEEFSNKIDAYAWVAKQLEKINN